MYEKQNVIEKLSLLQISIISRSRIIFVEILEEKTAYDLDQTRLTLAFHQHNCHPSSSESLFFCSTVGIWFPIRSSVPCRCCVLFFQVSFPDGH